LHQITGKTHCLEITRKLMGTMIIKNGYFFRMTINYFFALIFSHGIEWFQISIVSKLNKRQVIQIIAIVQLKRTCKNLISDILFNCY
jgi:hypothetical protein